ncbi:phage tail protein [Roseovarius sp. EL26]|uniref:phage tail protein n=1 Tax=Roseovarius sp. EL26 TaxID=2126672 RepID=UPI000EA33AB7|nr:tail fiber protein [Roseovarius sp. EL26]
MEPFIAQVMLFAGGYAPQGWAFCDGQVLPISGNESLFSLLGTTYGGDGRTTFALPDLRGRVPVHAGQGTGLTRRRLGQKFGGEAISSDDVEMQQHSNEARVKSVSAGRSKVVEGVFEAAQRSADAASCAAVIDPPGMEAHAGHHPQSDFPPSLCINYIIALSGVYPPRS